MIQTTFTFDCVADVEKFKDWMAGPAKDPMNFHIIDVRSAGPGMTCVEYRVKEEFEELVRGVAIGCSL